MRLVNAKDGALQATCVEKPGRFELDLDAGATNANCVFAMLSQRGYDIASLAIAGDKEWPSLEFLCEAVFPTRGIASKTHPDFPTLVTIGRKCKFEIATSLAHSVINRG